MLSVVFLGNWGLGLSIVQAIELDPRAVLESVFTQFDPESDDPWHNCIFWHAHNKRLPLFNTNSMKITKLRDHLTNIEPDLMITHAFMHRLDSEVYGIPRLGTINIHPSLLPAYRGPAPTYWVVRNGEKHTGLTAHVMDQGLDTGPIIAQQAVEIKPGDTVSSLIEKLKTVVKPLLTTTMDRILKTDFQPVPQDSDRASYAPRPVENA